MRQHDRSSCYPKVLVVSNNCFSDTSNNGKTLASFFSGYPPDRVAQLYFSSEAPGLDRYDNYFRISDLDLVTAIGRPDGSCGEQIARVPDERGARTTQAENKHYSKLGRSVLLRIGRELLWKTGKWKTTQLDSWLSEFAPDVVFFCAGDSGFAYDIVSYIRRRCGARLILYITDDYILPRRTISPFWWLRRHYIFSKMKQAIENSDLFYTISPQMQLTYSRIFGVNSKLAMNMTDSLKTATTKEDTDDISMVYAGGLHCNRYKTLGVLAQAIKKYNERQGNTRRALLRIFSRQTVSNRVLRYLNVEGASLFCGPLDAQELRAVLNASDVLVHVEAFDRRSIESTRLSISTKIPEYMSLEKPILAVGPCEVASMEYLQDCAFCVTDLRDLQTSLTHLLKDDELWTQLARRASSKFRLNHSASVRLQLEREIVEVARSDQEGASNL